MPEHVLHALLALAAGLLLGAALLAAVRRQDHRTWVLARAPRLPIRAVSAGDDVWLRGVVRAPEPLVCPWFGHRCVAYDYEIEVEHTTTRRDKDGNTVTETEWRTEHDERRAVDFELDDGDRIVVRVHKVDNEAFEQLGPDYETSTRRHSARIVEIGAELSVLGVVQDDGAIDCAGEVPCLITRKAPEQRVAANATQEAVLFFFACLLPFAGGALASFLLLSEGGAFPTRFFHFSDWLRIAAGGLAALLPIWWLGTFNRLVRLRQQVLAAFRQVDVDLAVRAALVPNLVAVVREHARHEQDLLEHLAALRKSGDPRAAAAAHGEARGAVRAALLLHERHPELRSNELYLDLQQRLWSVEEKLQHTRSLYNDIVTEWNDRLASFPSVLVARSAGCRPAPLFSGDDEVLPPRLRDGDPGPAEG